MNDGIYVGLFCPLFMQLYRIRIRSESTYVSESVLFETAKFRVLFNVS